MPPLHGWNIADTAEKLYLKILDEIVNANQLDSELNNTFTNCLVYFNF